MGSLKREIAHLSILYVLDKFDCRVWLRNTCIPWQGYIIAYIFLKSLNPNLVKTFIVCKIGFILLLHPLSCSEFLLSCLLLLCFPLIWKKNLLNLLDLVFLMTFKFYSHTCNSNTCCIIQHSQPYTTEDSSGMNKMKVKKKKVTYCGTYKKPMFTTFPSDKSIWNSEFKLIDVLQL